MLEVKDQTVGETSVFDQLSKNNHKKLVFCHDAELGLKAIIAIHDTTLGPALGGLRMWKYQSEKEAMEDVLRLSRSMTYKASITGLNLGGGGAVIIGDSSKDKTEALLRRFGRFIDSPNGEFIIGGDVGTNPKDMGFIRMETEYVVGIPEAVGGSGDPTPVSAYGVYMGMKACAKELWGMDSLAGKTVAVQGIGNVGEKLVKLLNEEDARIYLCDLDEERATQVAGKYDAIAVPNHAIYDLDIDIFAPCALGGTINADTIGRLKCAIIAGSANNQLDDEKLNGEMLMQKDILYAPDFLINAGGLISVYSELVGFNKKQAIHLTEHIYDVTREILKKSRLEQLPTFQAANMLAEKRISDIRKVKSNS
ncbi:MAG TPA: Glu/Leu/Phe/Val dehydrogenase [Anseongella sp.]|nr:Glu/Leu/Phe/Val dehydrogenase [Anseongella sp.]